MPDALVPRLCLGTQYEQALPAPKELSTNLSMTHEAEPRGLRSQAEPGNELARDGERPCVKS
jgi:hypothetical protein